MEENQQLTNSNVNNVPQNSAPTSQKDNISSGNVKAQQHNLLNYNTENKTPRTIRNGNNKKTKKTNPQTGTPKLSRPSKPLSDANFVPWSSPLDLPGKGI